MASDSTDGSPHDDTRFVDRHVGPSESDIVAMLRALDLPSLDALMESVIPASIRTKHEFALPSASTERELSDELRAIASQNSIFRSYIGMGYFGTHTPAVLRRNVLENPGYYTQYTPYQAEIAQGRLELLLNFQTMVSDLVGLPMANASLLDEATAAAEAMTMCVGITRAKRRRFFASDSCHPQTLAVLGTRAKAVSIQLDVGDVASLSGGIEAYAGVLVQYPDTSGRLVNPSELAAQVHAAGALLVVATDLLALTIVKPPGELGADIAVGSSQRFGVPMACGGPHAAFMATKSEHKRQLPGRIVGVSRDSTGKPAYRLALQTREQHIRRDRASSNICTSQVLLALVAGLYAAYHGPSGLRRIAHRIHRYGVALKSGLERLGISVVAAPFFDTLRILPDERTRATALMRAAAARLNLRAFPNGDLGISLDEKVLEDDIRVLLQLFNDGAHRLDITSLVASAKPGIPTSLLRSSDFLSHEVFNAYHSEHEMLRYLTRLQSRDLSLTTSMIPLGSCTMKLNPAAAMDPITWHEFAAVHPFAPEEQALGYHRLFRDLEAWLAELTGMAEVSLQPNAGAQGEYAGLLAIRAYHEARGQAHRRVCLIPTSAHGTNPASAVMAGLDVVTVACDDAGNIDLVDLAAQARTHRERLAALMLTYPSTHGVFEAKVADICRIVHEHGGQVYLDGANMNAQVGLCRPGDYGADVCHLNLHKTFAIPHGGGGPGVGPIAVASHLAPYLPSKTLGTTPEHPAGPVAGAPYGSAGVLPIPWAYIRLMGADGLRKASAVAILNANYMAYRLSEHYPVLFTGARGYSAHEFIIDMRPFKKSAGVEVDDVAKRLMDYGFHSPTMSFPVPGTLMIEPTESESMAELDRFCDAMIRIRQEIREIEAGSIPLDRSPLRNAPHTAEAVTTADWTLPYERQQGAFPAPWTRIHKYWPPVGRIDNASGDRHLICRCGTPESYAAGPSSRD